MRPSIDVLFRSAARVYGPEVLGIILSGNGIDGLAGAQVIRDRGGHVITQDPKNAMVDELPISLIKKGLADQYYPVEEIGSQVLRNIVQPEKTMQIQKYNNFNVLKTDPGHFNTV